MKYYKFYTEHQYEIATELFRIVGWFKDEEDIKTLLFRTINVMLLKSELSTANDVYVFKTQEDVEIVFFHKLLPGQNEEFKMRMYVLQDKLMFEWMLTGNKDGAAINAYNEFSATLEQARENHIGESV